MPLTENRKISILIGGFFLVGLISGVFFSRLSQEKKQDTQLSFTTQSIGNTENAVEQTYTAACPWGEEILRGNRVMLGNPLLDKSVPIVSMQQGLLSKNYDLYGPVGGNSVWKATLMREEIDGVVAEWKGSYGECIYSVGSQKIVALRHTNIENCTATNTPTYVGFSCSGEE